MDENVFSYMSNQNCPHGLHVIDEFRGSYFLYKDKTYIDYDMDYDSDDEEVRIVDASKNTSPFIVFGTDDKVISVDPFLYLLGKFREKLSQADLYVIIGYSFSDQHINNLLLQQLKSNTIKKIIIHSFLYIFTLRKPIKLLGQ